MSSDEPPFGRTELLSAIETMARHRDAPLHKPLALLWTIGRLAHGEDRLVEWPVFREGVGRLLDEWAPDSNNTPQYPFWHLTSSVGLWEAHGITGPPARADVSARAGFTEAAARLLRSPVIRAEAVDLLVRRQLTDVAAVGELLAQLGLSQRAPRISAVDLLRSLVGIEIRTATGRPNIVRDVDEVRAVVGTGRSPEGTDVPIDELQHGLDLLLSQGEVRVDVETLGHRSAFVGAVLAMVPEAQFVLDPARVGFAPESEREIGSDANFGSLDGTAQVKIRREQSRLRKLLAGDRLSAPCALCGHEYPVDFLVAAHIKKRSVCTDEERRDLHHVAMLNCAFGCDALYESGWITVAPDGRILAMAPDAMIESGHLPEQLDRLTGLSCSAHNERSEPYFAWHRDTIFRGAD